MSTEQCDLLRELSSNGGYHCLIVAKCALAVAGACGIYYQWRKQGVRFLVHDNTKVVFNIFYALNVFISISLALFYLFELIRLRFECFVLNFCLVLITKGNIISAINAAHNVLMIISFERLYSAIFPAHFEKKSSKILALLFSISVILISWFYTMYWLSRGFTLFETRPVALLDERIDENSDSFTELVIVSTCSFAISLCLFAFDMYLNFMRKPVAVDTSLSISYQRSENQRVILVILPIELTETLLSLITTSVLFLQTKFESINTPIDQFFFLQLATTPAALFPLLLAIIIELRVARKVQTSVTAADRSVDQMANLRRAWEVSRV